MPNPKRRHSKQRTAKRRSHDFLVPSNSNVCPGCGQYNKREVVAVQAAS